MRNIFDQLAKDLLDRALTPAGRVERQHEVRGEVQAVDAWFLPAPGQSAALAACGLLGRMGAQPTLFEAFHKPPGVEDLRGCVHKQLAIHLHQRREARTAGPQRAPRPSFPRLWIISAGEPTTVIQAYGFERMTGWPDGFWQRKELDAIGLVVVSELPRTPDTLMLRLMGSGEVLRQAYNEVHSLPADSWEQQVAIPLIDEFRDHLKASTSGEGKRFYMSTKDIYEAWLNEKRKDAMDLGLVQGHANGLRQAIRRLYEYRFGPLPPSLAAILDGTADTGRLDAWVCLAGTGSAEELATALASAPAASAPTGSPRRRRSRSARTLRPTL